MKNKLSTLAVAALFSLTAVSANADQVISSNTTSPVTASGGDIIINIGVTINTTSGSSLGSALTVNGVNVNNLTNNGSILQSASGNAINFNSLISSATITNNGQIGRYNGESNSQNTAVAINLSSRASVINNGSIDGTSSGSTGLITVNSGASGSSITNNGKIGINYLYNKNHYGIYVAEGATLSNFTNAAGASMNGLRAVASQGTIDSILNYGNIYSDHWVAASAIEGKVTSLTNYGTISGANGGAAINNTANTLINLSNAQGAKTGIALSIANLATNYNVIVNSSNDFGKLSVQNATGSMAFNINNGSTIAIDTIYNNVLTGLNGTSAGSSITGTNFTITDATGLFNGMKYSLVANSITAGGWDLVVAVPEADTSTMLLMGVGVMGFIARRRKQVAA